MVSYDNSKKHYQSTTLAGIQTFLTII